MKERPIIFTAPEIRAILAGRKTVTRRVVKPQPYPNGYRFDGRDILCHIDDLPANAMLLDVGRGKARYTTSNLEGWEIACPCGQPGERLWVRESGWERPVRTPKMMREGADTWPRFAYDADAWNARDHADFKAWGFKRRPSIHMPRWASRITLEIESVRVERLQDISEADAMAEGASELAGLHPCSTARDSFRSMWQQINGDDSWSANPWVWVLSFKRVTP